MWQVVEQHWVPQVSSDKADGPHRSTPPSSNRGTHPLYPSMAEHPGAELTSEPQSLPL